MPFTWKKKTRCTRFSQLVADHLQSPKRGGSLVVETGFPTSLIDLYVRNRGRFRKSSASKQEENDSPTPFSSLTSPDSSVVSGNLTSGALDYRESDEIIEEETDVGGMVGSSGDLEIENSSKTEVESSVRMAKLNPMLVAALKVSFIVVLILGTKRFKFGITMSAFLLFILELLGKPLLVRSNSTRSCVDSKPLVESSFDDSRKINSSRENKTLVACSEVLEIEEQVVLKEVKSEKESDEVRKEVLMEIRHKSSRKAIMKSRMKKLVPKKLRKSSVGSKGEISCLLKKEEEEEETVNCLQNLNHETSVDSKGENFCVLEQKKIVEIEEHFCVSKQNKIVEIEEQSSSSTLLSEIDCNNKKLGNESLKNSGFLVLCLIVLVGLIGGRVLALVLALSWCLIQKKSPWRDVKFPPIF